MIKNFKSQKIHKSKPKILQIYPHAPSSDRVCIFGDTSSARQKNKEAKMSLETAPTSPSQNQVKSSQRFSSNDDELYSYKSHELSPKSETITKRTKSKVNHESLTSLGKPFLVEFEGKIKEINSKIMEPMKQEIKSKRRNNTEISLTLENLKTEINESNKLLDGQLKSKKSLYLTKNANTCEFRRIKLENYSIQKEIEEIQKENKKMTNEINYNNKQKIVNENEYIDLKEEVLSIKKKMKILSAQSEELLGQKKIIKSALIYLNKKIAEMKECLLLMNKNYDHISQEMDMILSSYKIYENEP